MNKFLSRDRSKGWMIFQVIGDVIATPFYLIYFISLIVKGLIVIAKTVVKTIDESVNFLSSLIYQAFMIFETTKNPWFNLLELKWIVIYMFAIHIFNFVIAPMILYKKNQAETFEERMKIALFTGSVILSIELLSRLVFYFLHGHFNAI